MKRIKREPYIIKVSEVDFYTIYYALKCLRSRINANEYEVDRIINKLDQIIKDREKANNENTNWRDHRQSLHNYNLSSLALSSIYTYKTQNQSYRSSRARLKKLRTKNKKYRNSEGKQNERIKY